MKIGAYHNGSSAVAKSTIYIPLHNVTMISFVVAKDPYSSWTIYDDAGNKLKSNSGTNSNNVSCSFNVENYNYIQIVNNPSNSGSAYCTIKNFVAY